MKFRKLVLLSIVVLGSLGSKGQDIIQFSGLILTSDSLYPIPYSNISIKGRGVVAFSNWQGYFTFTGYKGDTIIFSHAEFKESSYIVPDTIKRQRYHLVKLLTKDTMNLEAAIIYPFPSRQTFDHVFVNNEVPDDKLERARKNLEREELKEQMKSLPVDGKESFRGAMQQYYTQKLYYGGGQLPGLNVLSPTAWKQFFDAWKRGDFKKKSKKTNK